MPLHSVDEFVLRYFLRPRSPVSWPQQFSLQALDLLLKGEVRRDLLVRAISNLAEQISDAVAGLIRASRDDVCVSMAEPVLQQLGPLLHHQPTR
jgi:hypothetical protein